MADEQTPQSDLIDDAIRQAERQLEAKLEALRMSALGEPAPAQEPADDDVAVLRPTGGSASSERADATTPAPVQAHADDATAAAPDPEVSWREAAGEDLTFTPTQGSVTLDEAELYVPEQDDASFDERPHEVVDHHEPAEQAHPALSSEVTGLTPVWDEGEPAVSPRTHAAEPAPVSEPEPPSEQRFEPLPTSDAWERPEPVHASWTRAGSREPEQPAPMPTATPSATSPAQPLTVTAVPSEDELEFWAQTRTALRTLQQLTEAIPGQVGEDVSRDVARIAREAVAPTDQALRAMHQQLQQQLPRLQDRLESAIEQSSIAPANGIRQVRDELPMQVDRAARELRGALREDLDQTAAAVHGAVQQDVAQLEQSIATNVTRMAQGTTDAVQRVERDVDVLGETVVRFERGVQGEFDRVESQLRTAIERVEQTVREELVEPAETVRKLDEELPSRFGRVERTLLEQMQSTQRDLSTVLAGIVEASRASLDRIAAMASTLDEDRARRAEDVEIIVDTVTTGWEGLAGAIKALFEQNEENSRRIAGIEQRLTQIRDLEGAVEGTMSELRSHIKDLTPAPIVVTVAHPEAEVHNSARGGWLPESGSDSGTN